MNKQPNLEQEQSVLKLNLIDFDLQSSWKAHELVNSLREKVIRMLPNGLYDPQDLEHQVLFRLTTFDPKDITDKIIEEIINEQFLIVRDRLNKVYYDLEYLFRGLSGKYQDLNVYDRLELCWQNDQIIAKNSHRSFMVEFKKVQDDRIISLFTNELHYIHKGRSKGDTFGLYFSGEKIPWAIETTEPSIISKEYKREALLAHGIDPNKAIELRRFYTLPGAPTNAISLMDKLVSQYYKTKGIEALFTTTMPMYSKTKGTTIAGGINQTLLVKELQHKFVPETMQEKVCYRHVTTISEDEDHQKIITTHHNFPTTYVVEVFKLINERSLPPLFPLNNKVIYVKQRPLKYEKEVKFVVKDIGMMIEQIRKIGSYVNSLYIRDIIFGSIKDKRKLRMRLQDDYKNNSRVEVIYKYRIRTEEKIKNEIEEMVYTGSSKKDALVAIAEQGNFVEENSYEKVRIVYEVKEHNAFITLDMYPHGTWIEIEGDEKSIWAITSELGFKKEDAINQNADELYLNWIKKLSLKECWDVRFGSIGEK